MQHLEESDPGDTDTDGSTGNQVQEMRPDTAPRVAAAPPTMRLGGACLLATSLLSTAGPSPLASQARVVELPSADLELAAEFGDVFRVGDGGAEWELLTSITSLAFDASGNLHITDVGASSTPKPVATPSSAPTAPYGSSRSRCVGTAW